MSLQSLSISCSEVENVEQGKEKIIVNYNGTSKELLTHDYQAIYKIPGLYEKLFYETFACQSPKIVCTLLKNVLEKTGEDPANLVVLDVGAGNGMVGEELSDMGVDTIIGVDIIEEAKQAMERDRPGIYYSYYVEDLSNLPQDIEREITDQNPNCMSIVAALGFGDIPAEAFACAYNMIADKGWIAFNIKDEFLTQDHFSGFSRLIEHLTTSYKMDIFEKEKYRHRFCLDGTSLDYYAIVAQKQKNISQDIIKEISHN